MHAMSKSPPRRMRQGALALIGLAALGMALLGRPGAALGQSASIRPSGSALVALRGHRHRLAQPRFDAGEAPSALAMPGLELALAKTPAQQQALDALLAAQQDPKSPLYHRWLTPGQYGARFGASDAVLASASSWLAANGFKVGAVPAGRGHLPFTGTKSQVEAAFHTEIHLFNVAGERHFANVSDPMIPASLRSAIAAIRGLNDFYPKPAVKPAVAVPRTVLPTLAGHAARASLAPDTYYSGSGQYPGYVGPTDFATMYDLMPLYGQGVTGAGITVAIVAQSDLDPSVLAAFWNAFGVAGSDFGLPAQEVTALTVPGGADPGETKDGNEDEAYLDTEIIGALAPGAKLVLVSDKNATLAAEYIVDQNLAAVINVSFGVCEGLESAENTLINSIWEQAVTEGITVTVAAGDAGGATCTTEANIGKANDVQTNGFAVNGLASTPFDLAVGGTDFNPELENAYWNTGNASGTLASAMSHIPEMVWNDTCANPVIASYFGALDPLAFCNDLDLPGTNTANPFIEVLGGGGGLSSCISTDTNGNCTGGYAQPSWQQGVLGIGSYGARALPDVAMIANLWLVCSYDTTSCDPTQAPTFSSTNPGTIKVLAGTSAAAPAVAAIIALLDQTQITASAPDGRQGLINATLYSLAASEYAAPATVTACDATQGAITNSACVFYDVTAGSNAQPCSVASYAADAAGSLPASTCFYGAGDATGIMAVGGAEDYAAGAGFDLASGLGSINAAALIAAVQAVSAPTGLAAKASGQTVTLTWTADAVATLGYDVYEGTGTAALSTTPVQHNVTGTTATISGLAFGQSYVFAVAAVSSSGVSPLSSPVGITLVPAAPTGLTAASAGPGSLTLQWTGSGGASGYDIYEGTASGAEGGTPVVTDTGSPSATLTGLTPGRQYFFTVTALDSAGASTASAQAIGTVLPAVPTGLSASPGNGSVSLSWTAVSGAASYDVYQSTSAGAEGSQPVKTGITGPSATIAGLSNGTTYYFTVAAVNAGGTSAASAEASAAPNGPKGGGGSMDWLALGLLALLAAGRSQMRPDEGASAAAGAPRA